ncbi:MAG: hypothetical protein AB1489_25655 [Acidobacteriota bacterium]
MMSSHIEQIIESIPLPLTLPEQAFTLYGNHPVPDFVCILNNLPPNLLNFLDLDKSAISEGKGSYLLPLASSGYLRIKLRDQAIIELSKI